MTFRKFDTTTWTDPWFEDLSPKAKLAFIYLWTNEICNPAGIYDLSEKRISFELGYGIDTIYSEISDKIYWNKDTKTIWVRNFFKRQCQNYKFAISALNSIKGDPHKLKLFIEYNQDLLLSYKGKDGKPIIDLSQYHTDTVPIPYPTEKKQRRSREEAEADKTLSASDDAVGVDGVDFLLTKRKRKLNGKRWDTFQLFWQAFDYKKGKREAADAWYDIPTLSTTLVEKIIKAAKKEARARPQLKANGKTPKMAQGWISGYRWEDEATPEKQDGKVYKKL